MENQETATYNPNNDQVNYTFQFLTIYSSLLITQLNNPYNDQVCFWGTVYQPVLLTQSLVQFYKQEVRLEEGIDVDNLFSGKGTTFTVKQESPLNDFDEFKKPELWDTSEISPIGIDPNAHKDVWNFPVLTPPLCQFMF